MQLSLLVSGTQLWLGMDVLGVGNPSPLNTWPKCPPHAVQVISIRRIPRLLSSCRFTAPGIARKNKSTKRNDDIRNYCCGKKILRSLGDYGLGLTIEKGWPAASTLKKHQNKKLASKVDNLHWIWWRSCTTVFRNQHKSIRPNPSAYRIRQFQGVQCLSDGESWTSTWLNSYVWKPQYGMGAYLFWRKDCSPFRIWFIDGRHYSYVIGSFGSIYRDSTIQGSPLHVDRPMHVMGWWTTIPTYSSKRLSPVILSK